MLACALVPATLPSLTRETLSSECVCCCCCCGLFGAASVMPSCLDSELRRILPVPGDRRLPWPCDDLDDGGSESEESGTAQRARRMASASRAAIWRRADWNNDEWSTTMSFGGAGGGSPWLIVVCRGRGVGGSLGLHRPRREGFNDFQ